MDKKTRVYVDTSAFISFLDQSDIYHPLFRRLFAAPPTLVTSSLVIAEGHGWFLKRYDATRALQFLDFINMLRSLTIVPVGSELIGSATVWLRKFSDQALSLADAAGLELMRGHKIVHCWSTDRHLALCGARLVIHEV